jgi:hypothetical protein
MRTCLRQLFENGLILRVGELRRHGVLSLNSESRGNLAIRRAGGALFEIEFVATLDDSGAGELLLDLARVSRQRELVGHMRIATVGTPSPWGRGRYLWFICPQTGRRCRTLYLPPGESFLACYAFWPRTHFAHASENRSRFVRSVEASVKARAELGGQTPWLGNVPSKPRRMSQRRYDMLVGRIDQAETATIQRILVLASQVDRAGTHSSPHTQYDLTKTAFAEP